MSFELQHVRLRGARSFVVTLGFRERLSGAEYLPLCLSTHHSRAWSVGAAAMPLGAKLRGSRAKSELGPETGEAQGMCVKTHPANSVVFMNVISRAEL